MEITPDGFMRLPNSVNVDELRLDIAKHLGRAEEGERLLITDQGEPVAQLGPPLRAGAAMSRLIAEERVRPPRKRGLPKPLRDDRNPYALTQALNRVRGGA